MKQKLLKFLAIFVAFLTAIPIANAADVTIGAPSLAWKTTLAPTSDAIMAAHSDIYGQGAASDGKIFTLPGSSTVSNYPSNMTQGYLIGENVQSIWSGGNSEVAFPYETSGSYYYLGPCIASDDAGTLWCASRRSSNPVHDGSNALVPWAVGARALTYYTERPAYGVAGTRKGIDLRTPSLQTSGRADIMSAYGDGVNGTGYFWFNIGSTTTIECIVIKNASTSNGKKITFTAPITSSTNRGYVKQFAAKRVLYNAGKSGTGTSTLYVGTLNASTPEESTSISWESTGLTVCRHGSTAFMLAGHEMIAYSKSTTQIALYDYTDKKEIGTITPFSTVSNISAISHSLDAKKVDDNNVDLYVYVPGQGGAKYTITATAITAPVSNLSASLIDGSTSDVKLTWDAPSQGTATKYAVSYSSDGGSTWSTAVETNDLSYTFSDLESGTYQFKVTPYFGGSSTWGEEVISEEINIIATPQFGYSFVVTKLWEVPGTLNNDGDETTPTGKSIAVSNGMLYVSAMNQYNTISYVNNNNSTWPNFPSGYNAEAFGYAMDNDDAGNIIVAANSIGSGNPNKFAVYPAGATSADNKKEFTLGDAHLPGARADYIGVQGNIYSGTGYMWLAPNGTSKIVRIKIENQSGTPTSTEITTWTHSIGNNSSEVIVRPLEDGRLYYHNHQNACRIITLPADGGEIPSANVETISLTTNQTNNFTSDAIILKDNVLNIRNAGVALQDISFEIYNATTGGFALYNNEQIITPFEGKRTTGEVNPLSGIDKYASIIRAVKVDDETVDVYVYSLYHGASCYRIGAEALNVEATPVENLQGEFVFNDQGEIWGRQDVVLTWDEPVGYSGATITGYNIYRDNKLQKTVDASTRTFTDINIVASPTYIVAPLYNGVEMEPKSVTVDYTFIPIPPLDLTARTYNGYGSVQLFWKRTTDVGIKPNYYNIYRDEILVGTSQTFNFYEDKLSAGEHKYAVEAVYNDMADKYISEKYGRTAKSDPVPIVVEARDSEKTTYTLEEIYNYTLDEISNQPANFDNRNYYRQGAYYNGKWYISQRSDQLCLKDQGVSAGSDYKSTTDALGSNDARGGVVVFSAVDPRTGVESKPITFLEGTNVGIASDGGGNLFVRQNNHDRLVATRPTDATKTEAEAYVTEDNFSRRMTSGTIYLASDNYATAIDVDLTGLNLSNILPDWNTLAADAYIDLACKSQRGRSDYYSLEGDVTSAEGAYLYFAPTKSAYVVRVNIKVANGAATVDVANAQVFNIAGEYKTIDGTDAKVTFGVENYAFPVYGRDAFIGQIRSNGYYGIHEKDDYHPIFTTESRINNSGGTTIQFNNDLFIISPQTMYSASSGDFMVSKGIKSDVADVATANLANPLPVAQWTQTKQASNVKTNASGNWLFAELGTFEISTGNPVECVYIYQYVPGERIAKYVLFPNNVFPAPPVAINLDPTYRDADGNEVSDENSSTGKNENAVDLLSFDGYAYWAKPDYDNSKADKYRYNCYKVKLYQEGGVMPTTTLYELGSDELNALGSETTTNTVQIGDKEFEYNYRLPIVNSDNKCIWRIEVYTTYANIEEGKESDTHDSEVSYAHTSDLYKGVAAKGTVKVYTQPNFPVWVDGNGNVVYKYMHRVDIDFNKPVFDGLRVEPVTHYEIWIDKAKDGVYEEQLMNFNLMTGKYNPAARAEVGTMASQIEVTDGRIVTAEYNPDTQKGYALGETESVEHINSGSYECVLSFYQTGSINPNEGGAMGEGDNSIELNPVNWNYQLRSVYAAGNTRITTTESYDMETGGSPILTGVEAVNGVASSLKLYPIPTDFILNVECEEPINVIEVYNEVGQLMMSVSGDQTQKMQIDLSDLFDGYYFVKVNSQAPVKILKK